MFARLKMMSLHETRHGDRRRRPSPRFCQVNVWLDRSTDSCPVGFRIAIYVRISRFPAVGKAIPAETAFLCPNPSPKAIYVIEIPIPAVPD
jgi:hypothetical protein